MIEKGTLKGKILDIRNLTELENGHIKEAILLNFNELNKKAEEKLSKNEKYYVHC